MSDRFVLVYIDHKDRPRRRPSRSWSILDTLWCYREVARDAATGHRSAAVVESEMRDRLDDLNEGFPVPPEFQRQRTKP